MSDSGLTPIRAFARDLRDELTMSAHREATRLEHEQHVRDLAVRKPSTLTVAERDKLRSARRNAKIKKWKAVRNARK